MVNENIKLKDKLSNEQKLDDIVRMIGSLASLDFTAKVEVDNSDDPLNAIAQGLTWLGEELESNVVEKSKLEMLNKNLEKFAFTAAHDMKSPLSSLFLLSDILQNELAEKYGNDAELMEYADMIRLCADQMRNLIDTILEYSLGDFTDLKKETIQLDELVNKVSTRFSIDDKIKIDRDFNSVECEYNETILRQVLMNLVDNSIKYNDKEVCEISIQSRDKGDYIEIAVADNGPGIEPKDRVKVFDLFETLRRQNKNQNFDSTGIGLATVKKIITENGGRIWIDPHHQVGTRFVFTIRK